MRHLKDIELLKQEHQYKQIHLDKKIESLKHQLEKSEVLNKEQDNHNSTLEKQLKEIHISSGAASFSILIAK